MALAMWQHLVELGYFSMCCNIYSEQVICIWLESMCVGSNWLTWVGFLFGYFPSYTYKNVALLAQIYYCPKNHHIYIWCIQWTSSELEVEIVIMLMWALCASETVEKVLLTGLINPVYFGKIEDYYTIRAGRNISEIRELPGCLYVLPCSMVKVNISLQQLSSDRAH